MLFFVIPNSTNVNFLWYCDPQKAKERHGLTIRRFYLIRNIILKISYARHVLASLVSLKTFSKSGLCIIFLILCVNSYVFNWAGLFVFFCFPPKTMQNFVIKFDITFSTKWNPDKIFKDILSAGAGWCHDLLKRCVSCENGAEVKIIGPPMIFIEI